MQSDDAVAGSGEGTGGVEHTLEHGVEVEVFGYAKTGLAEAWEALFHLAYPSVPIVRPVQVVTSIEIMVCGVNCAAFGVR